MNKLNKIVLKYGLEKMELWTDGELTIGKLLSFSQIQAQLGYNYHNVLPLRNGVALDFETSIGSEDITLVLETAVNVKGAVNRRKLICGLSRLVNLQFKRHGGRHDIFVTGDGVQIQIPRHPGDVADGTLRSIVRGAFPKMSLSEFKSKIS